jgi:hypothetical protein
MAMPLTRRDRSMRSGPRIAGRRGVTLALLAILSLVLVRASASESVDPPPEGGVPMVTLDALPLGVPLARLDGGARGRAEAVLDGSLFAHRVTGLRARSREPVFLFLLDHPHFAAALARALRLGRYRVTLQEDGYWGDDRRGARGRVQVLYADERQRLFHLEGMYEGRGLPAIRGRMLVLLEFRHEDAPAGGTEVDVSVTGHVRLDTPLVGALAQLAATLARPAVERAVERKVRRFFGTVARVSRWASDEPEQIWAALEGHPEVPQDATLVAFREILLADRPPAWMIGESFRLLPAEATEVAPASSGVTSP